MDESGAVSGRRFGLRRGLAVGVAVAALLPLAATMAHAGADTTFDVHFRVYCDPPTPIGANLCFPGSGWKTVSEIRKAFQRRVMPVLNRIYEPSKVSFRLYDLTYDTSRPDFTALKTPGKLDPPDADADRVRDMREIARQPGNSQRIQIFAVPKLGTAFSAVPDEFACSGGTNDLRTCNPNDVNACPGGGICESLPNYGVFVGIGLPGDPILLAHEMGHHLCLGHTHTGLDRNTTGAMCKAPVGHDGDGLTDTPPDPAGLEAILQSKFDAETPTKQAELLLAKDAILPDALAGQRHPSYAGLDFRPCHQWCDWSRTTVGFSSPINQILGEPKRVQLCSPVCYETSSAPVPALQVDFGSSPDTALVLSYYFRECSGPWTVGTTQVPALSTQETARITTCLQNVAERVAYTDVCQIRGGDSDSDGICDQDDVCKLAFNSDLMDTDGDGIPDACDTAKLSIGNLALDTDFDFYADAVDPDLDGDGCSNSTDQHPDLAQVPIATEERPGCTPDQVTLFAFEGADSDNDGFADCADGDDDDDSLADDVDPCPLVPGTTGCTGLGGVCPPPWVTICAGPGCLPGFELVLVSLVDPTEQLAFDFQIIQNALVVPPLPGRSVEETLVALRGGLFTPGRSGPPAMRLEIRARGTGAAEAIVVDDFQANDVTIDFDVTGSLLVLTPDGSGGMTVARTFGVGAPPGALLPDEDGDGVPDTADNCRTLGNAEQIDSDRDGFGNACDLDLDQNGVVTSAERLFVDECLGVDFGNPVAMMAAGEGEDAELASTTLDRLGLQARCAAADLDANGVVDLVDTRIAEGRIGQPPGPSGLTTVPEPLGFPAIGLAVAWLAGWARRRMGGEMGPPYGHCARHRGVGRDA